MKLITCKENNCPTPHFYVNPKGGKIIFSIPLDTPSPAHLAPKVIGARIAAMSEFALTQKTPEKFTEDEREIIKDWYEKMQKEITQENRGVTIIEDANEVSDYLVVYCESNHQNYIPLI